MAKSKIRVATATEGSLIAAIDEGAENDATLKTATNKDKEYKQHIVDNMPGMQDGETSLRLMGKSAEALVTVQTTLSIDTDDADFDIVREGVDKGKLDGVVSKKVVATIAPDGIEEIRKLVGTTVFDKFVAIETRYIADPEGLREMDTDGSPEVTELKRAVEACVTQKSVKKVKFKKL